MPQTSTALASPAEASVRQLIANGKFKTALDRAKEHHKAEASASSEALLIDAYAARIRSLLETNLPLEAKALLDLVRDRYPSAKARVDELKASFSARAGLIEELLAPLNDPELSEERRASIEQAVRNTVTDLAALATCPALPADHSLRMAAAALDRAFNVVTSGPVTDEQIALAEVSHRSPLASWKPLVRAIACFYRGDDDACLQWLGAIHPESVAARLVPAMQTMLGVKTAAPLTPAAAALTSRTIASSAQLRQRLEELDEAFAEEDDEDLAFKFVRMVVQECRRSLPEKLEALKRLIFVRGAVTGLDDERLIAAMEGMPRQDASFFRMLARGLENSDDAEDATLACGTWDSFRQQAVHEGWFPAKGVEVATLYLHMAGVLRQLPADLLKELQRGSRSRKTGLEDAYFLFPETLYERACALDPHPESFTPWLRWAEHESAEKGAKVAQAWHKIRPTDIEPLLYLIRDAEKRDAFSSALQYLDEAEQIDAVHSVVRAARLRLLAGSVVRHLQQKKPHLAAEKLAAMEALPPSRQGDRPAFLASLRYLIALDRGDGVGQAQARADVDRSMGSEVAAAVLMSVVSASLKRFAFVSAPPIKELTKAERVSLPAALARVMILAQDLGLAEFGIPETYLTEAEKQFPKAGGSLDASQLRTLAEMALGFGKEKFAYAASAAGLQLDEATAARFLFLRAQSVPDQRPDRRAVCAAAAAELARAHRDMKLVDRAVELVRREFDGEPFSLTLDQARAVLAKEKAASTFPKGKRGGPDYSKFLPKALCNCPACRFKRGEIADPFEDDFDEAEMKRAFDEKTPKGIPPELAEMLFEVMKQAYLSGEDPDKVIARLMDDLPPGGSSKKGRRK